MGEAVADESQLALLDILLDGIEELFLANLFKMNVSFTEDQDVAG